MQNFAITAGSFFARSVPKIKSRYLKVGICVVIFFSLIGVSNMLMRPAYNKIGDAVKLGILSFERKIEKDAGLRFVYSSFSPSILSGINLNNIAVYDVQSGKFVGAIRRLSISYSFSKIIRGDVLNALKSVSLRDVDFEIARGENDFWLQKISRAQNSLGVESSATEKDLQAFFENLNLEDINLSFLNDVRIYRLRGVYKTNNMLVQGDVTKAVFTGGAQDQVDAKADCVFKFEIASQRISGNLDFSATLPKGFEGSSAVLRFSNVSAAQYRARYLGFLAEYSNRKFNLSMLPGSQNFFVKCSASLDSGDISADVYADNFSVARMVQTSSRKALTAGVFSMNFSFDGQLQYNVKTKKLEYNSDGDVFVPAGAIPKKEYACDTIVSYSFNGDEKKIRIPYLQTWGERYNMTFDGAYDFEKARPEGNLYVESIVLPNGSEFSTEVYVEEMGEGFMCFSPEVRFGKQTFTAAQLDVMPGQDSWDFTFEVSDYAHTEAEKPGLLSFYGSFAPKSSALQASVSLDSIYLDAFVRMYSFFAENELQPLLENFAKTASPYVFSCDSFASGEDGVYSFNIPYAFVVNTVRDDQMLILAADGNKENVRISNLDFVFGDQRLLLNADTTLLGEDEGYMLGGHIDLNGIPYDFNGFFNESWISINSEYGFQFTMSTDTSGEEAVVSGNFGVVDFPVRLSKHTYSFATQSEFSYSLSGGFNADIPYFEGSMIDGTDYLNPALRFSAKIFKEGAKFEGVSYSDNVSTLNGMGQIDLTGDGENFENASFLFGLANPDGAERISLYGDVSNPMRVPVRLNRLSSVKLLPELFVTATLNIDALRSQRFAHTSTESDSINAKISMQGSIANPFVSFEVPRAVFTVQNKPLVLTAHATLEDMVASAYDVSIDYGRTQIKNLTANFDFKKYMGSMSFALGARVFGREIATEVFAKAEALSEVVRGIPESINFAFETGPIRQAGKKNGDPFSLNILKLNNDFVVSSSENIGVSGTVSNYKDVKISVRNSMPLEAEIEGTVTRNEINLAFTDISANLPNFIKTFGIRIVNVYKGELSGGFVITGSPKAPYFSGALDIVPAEFNCPSFFKKRASTDKITLIMDGSEFYTEPTRCELHRTPVDVTVNIQMNRLAFESLSIDVVTVGEKFAPLNMNLKEIHVKGDFQADLNIVYDTTVIAVSGDLVAKDTNAEFGATRLNEIISGFSLPGQEEEKKGTPVDVSLNIKTRSRVQIGYSSFLRAVIVPGSELEVTYFGEQERLLLDGSVAIRSGEISYLNSSFYIKEGSIHFSDNDESFDPRISVRAETKTRDSKNEFVTITMTVDNQHLSELSPRLVASPARSEREVIEILGSIISADSKDMAGFALATGDYAIQTIFTRKVENALRDFFKFDIFSVRTMVVQNAVHQSFDRETITNPAGNYLDGTSVYIGKYLGDSLFADATIRLDYDENRVRDKYTLNGLSFRPEIGFELEAPFAKVRWSMSPDLEDILNLRFVQNTALTLSWKFNF